VRNLVKAHERVKDFDWDHSYAEKPDRYPTKYKIPRKTKDPFRHLIRDYVSMEQEKDDRQYGAMEDALARSNSAGKAQPRWMEILKIAIPTVNFGEYAAMKSCGQLVDTVDNAELRQGYMAQMIDEVRHTNQEIYLNRYFAKHAADPEGFHIGLKARGINMFGIAGRAALEAFFVGDPIEGALNLQVVAETAYTNPIFVTLTEVAAANGDNVTPSVFLSIQSDEARHMANGYSTLAAVVSNEDNLKYLQDDFDRAFWRQHAFLDPFLGTVYDYFQKDRGGSYLEKWNEWIVEDWVGSYISKMEPYGLAVPECFAIAQEHMKWKHHTTAMLAAASWPFQFWRWDPLTQADFEWFENKYPGWYKLYGAFWENFAQTTKATDGVNPMAAFEALPPLCQVCQMPCIMPRLDCSEVRFADHAGRTLPFCGTMCEKLFFQEPIRYEQSRTFWQQNHGLGLDEYIVQSGLLRSDGKTLIAQPSLDTDRMWTIDDVKAWGMEITDPMVAIHAERVKAKADGAVLNGSGNGAAGNGAALRIGS
jgi:hypothetical protein